MQFMHFAIATYMYSTRVLLSKLMLCIVCMYDLESLFEDSPRVYS